MVRAQIYIGRMIPESPERSNVLERYIHDVYVELRIDGEKKPDFVGGYQGSHPPWPDNSGDSDTAKDLLTDMIKWEVDKGDWEFMNGKYPRTDGTVSDEIEIGPGLIDNINRLMKEEYDNEVANERIAQGDI